MQDYTIILSILYYTMLYYTVLYYTITKACRPIIGPELSSSQRQGHALVVAVLDGPGVLLAPELPYEGPADGNRSLKLLHAQLVAIVLHPATACSHTCFAELEQ